MRTGLKGRSFIWRYRGGCLSVETASRTPIKTEGKPSFTTRQLSLATVLIALGVAISPFLWFPILDSKAFPGQHIVNSIAGVLLGPFWAAVIATCIGLIRMSLGIGTIFSLPGGIPGGVVVGIAYWLLKKADLKHSEFAALTESLGTIFIGGSLAVLIVAPIVGREMILIPVWVGWSLSCIPGSIVGFIILEALKKAGFTRETFRRQRQ